MGLGIWCGLWAFALIMYVHKVKHIALFDFNGLARVSWPKKTGVSLSNLLKNVEPIFVEQACVIDCI